MRVRFIYTAVATHQPVVGVAGVNPDAVVVYVFVALAGWHEFFTAVGAVVHVGIHRKDFVDVFWIAEDFLVIVAAGRERSLLRPAFAFIAGAEYATFVVAGFYNSIHDICIGRRNS